MPAQEHVQLGFLAKLGLGKERDYILENLSALVGAGIGVLDAFASIQTEIKSRPMKKVISSVISRVANGESLWKSMELTGAFNLSDITLIRIGEETGQLSKNLEVVALQNRKNQEFKSKIKSAMLYPVMVLTITVVVAVGTAWFILPKLANVFRQMRIELPFLTRIIIKLGIFLQDYGAIAVPIFFCFVALVIFFIFLYPKTRHIGQAILFRLPGVGRLMREVEIARFGYLLSLLISSGVPIIQSLDSFATTATLRPYQALYAHLQESVRKGQSFQQALHAHPNSKRLIPTPIQQMIVAGEQSGKLSDMLSRISVIYESKVETTTKNLTIIIEPLLLIVVWAGVLMLALAVIMPIYGLLQGLR